MLFHFSNVDLLSYIRTAYLPRFLDLVFVLAAKKI